MKMKLLSAAIAGLGVAGAAQAVYVNPDGLGEVLLYPYYTVQNNYETYFHIVNTTNQVKAVKVRFLEGMNSQEVLDFNLYLSPYDEWAAKVFDFGDTRAAIKTSDTSCTTGTITSAGIPFRNYQYRGDSIDTEYARTREGYIEVIEMGNVTDTTLAADATHTGAIGSRVPVNCAAVAAAATTGGVLNQGSPYISAPTGGLYGFTSLISVGSGLRTSVDAIALANFAGLTDLHTPPGNLAPSLASVATNGQYFDGANAMDFAALGSRNRAVDPVSAILMRSSIINDYVIDAARNSSTNWVVTFPTKRFYVNDTSGALAPFASLWDKTTATSCDPILRYYYDREESVPTTTTDPFSPPPPGLQGEALCHEVNTVSFKRDGTGSAATLFGAVYTTAAFPVAAGFDYGWAQVIFTGDINNDGTWYDAANNTATYPGYAATLPGNVSVNGATTSLTTLYGLPVIGFAAFTSENTLAAGLSNYMGSIVQKSTQGALD